MGNIHICEEILHAEHLSDTCDVWKLHLKPLNLLTSLQVSELQDLPQDVGEKQHLQH